MNLSQLDDNESRRVLDYIAGAIFITKAEIVNVGNKIFCSIPSNRNFLNEMNRETSHEEEEVEIVRG